MIKGSRQTVERVVGIDLGDQWSQLCELGTSSEEILVEGRVRTTPEGLQKRFGSRARLRIAMETGTHSPWVSRLLRSLGHEVVVANSSKLRLIYRNRRKSDRVDARYLARLARADVSLLAPVAHRGVETQVDLAILRSRDAMVRARSLLINHVRGSVKAMGSRLPASSTPAFVQKVGPAIPEGLQPALLKVLAAVTTLSEQIKHYDRQIEQLAAAAHPEAAILRQVQGVGGLTSLAYVLTLEDANRFTKSRAVGAYLGLVPGQESSGQSDPQCRITKEGDTFLRRLLVQSAQYIVGPFGQDCDLRRYGERLSARGGKNGKKRAVIAVARKLAVLLHRLWRTGEVYRPLRASATAPLFAVNG